MKVEKQYFDAVEIINGYVCAIDEVKGTKTPLDIECIGTSNCAGEIVLMSKKTAWWYSRKKYIPEDMGKISEEILKAINKQNRYK